MNICIINEGFHLGGVERVVIEMANSFKKNGEDVTLIDFSGKNIFYYNVEKDIKTPNVIKSRNFNRKVKKGIQYIKYEINKKPFNIINLYKEQLKELINYLKNSNHEVVILCQGILTALLPILKSELPNIKMVAWQHNEFDVYIKNYYKRFVNDYLLGV
ncbi:glycosyltransferase family 4 protein, partial [Bacillus sp. MUM 116]|uniref:glycosyltransferase family 4 protein n=1 Tax=Bacillus sp. MUM 116 TaxID=1678002 RepID=UPI00114D3F4E